MLNRRNDVVLEGFYSKKVISYKKQVLMLKARFEYLQIKTIVLEEEEELNLFYN